MSEQETWRDIITEELVLNGETWADVVDFAVARDRLAAEGKPSLDRPFDSGFGFPQGDSFTVWTGGYVYFPVVYDGAESCGSVPRNPGGRANPHVGGW